MTDYLVPKRNVDDTDPTFITWGWHMAAPPAGVTGFKLTIDATGSGAIQYRLAVENPETSSGPPEDWWTADPGVTTMNFVRTSTDLAVPGEMPYSVTLYPPIDLDWSGGITYADPVDNLVKSLHAAETTGLDYFVAGRIITTGSVTITGYELILFGESGIPTRRKTNRNDRTRRGAGISSRQRSTRRAGGYL